MSWRQLQIGSVYDLSAELRSGVGVLETGLMSVAPEHMTPINEKRNPSYKQAKSA